MAGKKPHQGTTVKRDDPDVDPVKVWKEGFEPSPTLAEQLAVSLTQEILVPGHLEAFAQPDSNEGRVIPMPQVVAGLDPEALALEDARQLAGAVFQMCAKGHEAPGGAKFCPECGEPFQVTAEAAPNEWTCQSGHLIHWDAKFCQECGDARPDLRAPVSGAGLAAEMMARPAPEETLTPEQKAARAAQHAAALRMGAEDPQQVIEKPRAGSRTILFHVRKSGWTFAGVVWMRGQEIELAEGTARWQEAQDFIHLDEAGQVARWGRECFRLGPWPGQRSYTQAVGDYQAVTGSGAPTLDQLQQADAQEAARGRGVPAPMYVGGMRP
jgi:hypothetical protein